MTVKERLKEYLISKRIRINHFEKSIGAANGFVNNMRMSISPEKLESITKEYNDLNIAWLLTGEGEMIAMQGKDLDAPVGDKVSTVSEPQEKYEANQDLQLKEIIKTLTTLVESNRVLVESNAKLVGKITNQND